MRRALAATVGAVLVASLARAQEPPRASRPMPSRSGAARTPPGAQEAAPPAAPSLAPDVTRAEAEQVLAALARAWAAEDPDGVARAYDAPLQWSAVRDARKLFGEQNFFVTAFRPEPSHERMADGALTLFVTTDRSARPLRALAPRRLKWRSRMTFARRAGVGVVLAAEAPAESGILPPEPPWRTESVTAEVRLDGLSMTPPRITIRATLTLLNASAAPATELGFALHPFSEGLAVRASGAPSPMTAVRTEASLDAWRVAVPAVAPGARASFDFDYALTQPGATGSCAIDADAVRLSIASAWLPLVDPPRVDDPDQRSHDVVVVVPDGFESSMPGRREGASAAAGFHAARFVSELASPELPLVAVRGAREERRLGERVLLDVLRKAGGGDPRTAVSEITTLAGFLEDRLGPCPVQRIALAETGDGGFLEAPGFMALPNLQPDRYDADLPEQKAVFRFLGLSMARLWVRHGLAPQGPGSGPVTAGLCAHLAAAWADAAVKPGVARRQREQILSFVVLDPQLDRPLLPASVETDAPPVFKQGKAQIAFDMYERLAGAAAWGDALLGWATTARRGGPIEALVARMGGTEERDAFVDAFFRQQGACQVSIADVRLVPMPAADRSRLGLDAAWQHAEIDVLNTGLGPVPLDVLVDLNGVPRTERVVAPSVGRTTLRFPALQLPTRVLLDPEHLLWQSRQDDDAWPPRREHRRRELDTAIMEAGAPGIVAPKGRDRR